jgi:hypothetical protein
MIIVTARHATPTTCTSRGKQTQFSKRNKDKRKTKQNSPGFKFKPRQVNDSSQSNQGTDHLVSQLYYIQSFSVSSYCQLHLISFFHNLYDQELNSMYDQIKLYEPNQEFQELHVFFVDVVS